MGRWGNSAARLGYEAVGQWRAGLMARCDEGAVTRRGGGRVSQCGGSMER